MSRVYWARFFREEVGYSVDVPDMPGCFTEGDTFEEAYHYLTEEAIPCWLGNDPWPPARGPEEVLAAERVEGLPEPLLVQVVLSHLDSPPLLPARPLGPTPAQSPPDTGPGASPLEALPESLVAELAKAAAVSGRPAADLLAQAAREYLERRSNGRV